MSIGDCDTDRRTIGSVEVAWERAAARVLVIDELSRLLLVAARDPDDGRRIWFAPGGGVEPGETAAEAAVRELAEEVEGLFSVPLEGPVWKRRHLHTFAGRLIDLTELYFVARVHAADVRGAAETGVGARYFDGWRWWSLEELEAFDGILAPRRLPELLPAVLRGEVPDRPIETGE
jgi:8-oxo-dGTP pyrophosphatase MutT (NUDIX family)